MSLVDKLGLNIGKQIEINPRLNLTVFVFFIAIFPFPLIPTHHEQLQ
jgi:hypothetical protein